MSLSAGPYTNGVRSIKFLLAREDFTIVFYLTVERCGNCANITHVRQKIRKVLIRR